MGRENLMVLRADELRNNQNETCARLFEFLSVGYIEIPETIANITGDSRIPFLNKMMRSEGNLKKVVRDSLPRSIRISLAKTIGRLNTKKKSSASRITSAQRERLLEIYKLDRQYMRNVYGIEFKSGLGN